MKALLDTCIIIDALQNRIPFCESAQKILISCAENRFTGFITAKSLSDIYYITHRYTHDNSESRKVIEKLCKLFKVLDTTSKDCAEALYSQTADFEDAIMIQSAINNGMDCIITRNVKDYTKSPVAVLTPDDFLIQLRN